MRTETRTYDVYKVDELSFTAKENAYNRWLAGYEYPWQSENMATLKAFEGLLFRVQFLVTCPFRNGRFAVWHNGHRVIDGHQVVPVINDYRQV